MKYKLIIAITSAIILVGCSIVMIDSNRDNDCHAVINTDRQCSTGDDHGKDSTKDTSIKD